MSFKFNTKKGQIGENLAEQYILDKGYQITARNWHYSKNAEIDIIAEKDNCLVFIEVKTRTNLNYGHPFEAIDKKKIEKIHNAINAYMMECEKNYKSYRLDGIAIIGLKNPIIEHLENIGQF